MQLQNLLQQWTILPPAPRADHSEYVRMKRLYAKLVIKTTNGLRQFEWCVSVDGSRGIGSQLFKEWYCHFCSNVVSDVGRWQNEHDEANVTECVA